MNSPVTTLGYLSRCFSMGEISFHTWNTKVIPAAEAGIIEPRNPDESIYISPKVCLDVRLGDKIYRCTGFISDETIKIKEIILGKKEDWDRRRRPMLDAVDGDGHTWECRKYNGGPDGIYVLERHEDLSIGISKTAIELDFEDVIAIDILEPVLKRAKEIQEVLKLEGKR